jgi:hypothetical protein
MYLFTIKKICKKKKHLPDRKSEKMNDQPKNSTGKEKQHHLYKVDMNFLHCDYEPSQVIVIGDYAVGKTSLIKRYTEGYFTPNYKLTIGN